MTLKLSVNLVLLTEKSSLTTRTKLHVRQKSLAKLLNLWQRIAHSAYQTPSNLAQAQWMTIDSSLSEILDRFSIFQYIMIYTQLVIWSVKDFIPEYYWNDEEEEERSVKFLVKKTKNKIQVPPNVRGCSKVKIHWLCGATLLTWIPCKLVIPSCFISWKTHFLMIKRDGITSLHGIHCKV